jgi:hypothetical protein
MMSQFVPKVPDGWRLVHEGLFRKDEEYAFWYPGVFERYRDMGLDIEEKTIGTSSWFRSSQPRSKNIRTQIEKNSFVGANTGPYFVIKKVD